MSTGLEPVIPALERRGVRPATLASELAIGPELESGRPRLRGVLLEPLCIADQAFGAPYRELRLPVEQGRTRHHRLPASLRNWCSVSESNRAGPEGQQLYRLHGVRPRLTLRLVPPVGFEPTYSRSSGER